MTNKIEKMGKLVFKTEIDEREDVYHTVSLQTSQETDILKEVKIFQVFKSTSTLYYVQF